MSNSASAELVLEDILAPNLRVVFCGINPGLTSATRGHHFVNRSNRFWKTIYLAGFTNELITSENDRSVLKYGIGLTTAVARPTKRADELARHEFAGIATTLSAKLERYSPRCVAFLGKPAYSTIVRRTLVHWGRQELQFAGCETWVLPNPSGLNRSFRLDELVRAYTELRVALDQNQIAKC
ncbi:G/U mismatch-specific DNA glycosylase [Terriglobus roseus]|uniref:G/U mismatch-specific uracil-DNA glycosylase n=1 Tax=Terriglobus roseus TaxID=392734 RepID=A0A1G7GAB1_9BACT|nr:G/U mismatch-specific DNA glycosylase [Terriglobus roseus]SDE85088.1 G/U mismatch-specific uracil-DNA glycosylase [Terriglobus roseus]